MKKLISLLMALVLTLSLSLALAEEGTKVSVDDLKGIETPDYGSYADQEQKASEDTKGSATTDQVTFTDTGVSIALPSGLKITYNPPKQTILCLTQDILQQSDLFCALYKEPLEVVTKWIDQGMHLNMFNYETNTDAYIYVFDTALAAIYQDSSRLSEEDAEALYNYMYGSEDFFSGATDGTYGWLGGNVWFLGNMREVNGQVRLISFVGGKEVFCLGRVTTEDQYKDLIAMLDGLTISVE